MQARSYFDNAATTPMDPRVREAVEPYLIGLWAIRRVCTRKAEWRARRSRRRGLRWRRRSAREAGEIVFTGSGTEADNMANRWPKHGDHLQQPHHFLIRKPSI